MLFSAAEMSRELPSQQRSCRQVSRTLMTHSAAKHLRQSKTLLGKSHLCLTGFLLLHWRKKAKAGGGERKDSHKTYFPLGM